MTIQKLKNKIQNVCVKCFLIRLFGIKNGMITICPQCNYWDMHPSDKLCVWCEELNKKGTTKRLWVLMK